MGKKKWDGTQIDVGYSAIIGNKEIEVDSRISKAEMPTVTGSSAEYENDQDFGDPPQTQTHVVNASPSVLHVKGTSIARKDSRSAPVAASPSTTKKSVSATSFYAHAPPKPKPKGPLYVIAFICTGQHFSAARK